MNPSPGASRARTACARRRRLDPTSGNAFRPLYDLFSGSLTTKMFASAPRGVEALYDAWLIARRLVQRGAVALQIYAPIEDFFLVRWIPAVMAEDVRDITARAGAAFAHVEDSFLRITGRPQQMDPILLGELALSLFIQSYIEAAYAEIQRETGDDVPDHEALFGGRAVDTRDDAEAKAIGMRLESWTSPVFAQTRPHAADPVLIVHDLMQQTPEALEGDAADDVSVAVSVDADTAGDLPIGLELKFDVKSPDGGKRKSLALLSILNDKAWQPIRFDCLRTVSRLSGYCPELAEILRTKTEMQRLSLDAVAPTLFEALPALKLLGVRTVLPRSLRSLLKPEANMQIDLDEQFKEGSGIFDLASLMNFHWQLAVGGEAVSPEEFNELCSQAGRIVRFRDGYMFVTQKEVSQIKRRLAAKSASLSKAELL